MRTVHRETRFLERSSERGVHRAAVLLLILLTIPIGSQVALAQTTSAHATSRGDTIVVTDSSVPILTEDLLTRMLVFGARIAQGQHLDSIKGKHENCLLYTNVPTCNKIAAVREWIPVSIVVDGDTLHFLKARLNVAAVAKTPQVAAGLQAAGLTPSAVERFVVASYIAWHDVNGIGVTLGDFHLQMLSP